MFIDVVIKVLKLKDKLYKVFDCDGMYVVVNLLGVVVFCYDYCMYG